MEKGPKELSPQAAEFLRKKKEQEQQWKTALANTPFEKRDEVFVLNLFQSGLKSFVAEALKSSDVIPIDSRTVAVAKACSPFSIAPHIEAFRASDQQEILLYIINSNEQSYDIVVSAALKKMPLLEGIDRRAVTEALLRSPHLHPGTFFRRIDALEPTQQEIHHMVDEAVRLGAPEDVIENVRKILGVDEEALIRQILSSPKEQALNGSKILFRYSRFRQLSLERIEEILKEYPEALRDVQEYLGNPDKLKEAATSSYPEIGE